jgi:hypothetical protein
MDLMPRLVIESKASDSGRRNVGGNCTQAEGSLGGIVLVFW